MGTNRERLLSQLKLWDENASLVAYTIRHRRERRARFEAAMDDPRWAHIAFIRLRSQEEIDDVVRSHTHPEGAVRDH